MTTPVSNNTGHPSRTSSSTEVVKRYVGIISLVSTLLIVAVFWGFYTRTTNLIKDQLLHEARAFFEEIVQTRRWIINQQGVYVKMGQDMRPDPGLESIAGLKTTLTDQDGERYVLRHHAVITKMISALAQKDQNFTINITSLNPLDQENSPSEFEQTALEKFESGAPEFYRMEESPDGPTFRFMAPLVTQKECLPCHAAQGYKVGDIRGGISISIPAQRVIDELVTTRTYTIIAAITILAMLLSAIVYISQLFVRNLHGSEKQLVELAITDSLTGILNRGEGIRRIQQEIARSLRIQQPLSLVLIDVDHFKKINDNFGHQIGDQVLRSIVATLTTALRRYDVICRYGGEEFLVMLPNTELSMALETAERLRQLVAESEVSPEESETIKMTISLGVSSLQPDDSLDNLVYRADNALYLAKQEGRDQVQFIA